MRYRLLLICCFTPLSLLAADKPKPNTLAVDEIKQGMLLLFDGETTFGWKVEGEASVKDGVLTLGGTKEATITSTSSFAGCKVSFEFSASSKGKATVRGLETSLVTLNKNADWIEARFDGTKAKQDHRWQFVVGELGAAQKTDEPHRSALPIRFTVAKDQTLQLRNIKLAPETSTSLFNGKDLTGWKQYTAGKNQSKFTVTKEGWLNVKDGPGDLQTTEQWADFVFQTECISNGKHLNSGIFFRCILDQYQQGYEAQIRNQWEGDERTKPVDFGTGAIYRRQAARKVVSSDNEWFTLTVVAFGNHLATWVNGYPVADWTDDRKANDNARQGSKTSKGALSIQGHDPTTDLSFRNLRIMELPSKP